MGTEAKAIKGIEGKRLTYRPVNKTHKPETGLQALSSMADEIWSIDYFGADILFFLLTRKGEMKEDDPHALTALPEIPAVPNNLSLLLQRGVQGTSGPH